MMGYVMADNMSVANIQDKDKNICNDQYNEVLCQKTIGTNDFLLSDTISKIQELDRSSYIDSDKIQDKILFHFHVGTDMSTEHLIPLYKRNDDGTVTTYY